MANSFCKSPISICLSGYYKGVSSQRKVLNDVIGIHSENGFSFFNIFNNQNQDSLESFGSFISNLCLEPWRCVVKLSIGLQERSTTPEHATKTPQHFTVLNAERVQCKFLDPSSSVDFDSNDRVKKVKIYEVLTSGQSENFFYQ
ncbi:hypothetical protein QVD17_13120 [Tagetes erecta]|uniref:Uncharacterized protein n=1 Tax=Tagetes erecta TaxID=13708 RepID=A0AAD8P3A3_TARER|nr:hypothetical protein QVD17_13120 [Tagetes erecta]